MFASPAGERSLTTPLTSAWCVTVSAVCADAKKSLKNKVNRSSSRVDVCFEETEVLLSLTSQSLAAPLRQTAICSSAVRLVWTTGYFFLSLVGDNFILCRLEVFRWQVYPSGRFGTLKIKNTHHLSHFTNAVMCVSCFSRSVLLIGLVARNRNWSNRDTVISPQVVSTACCDGSWKYLCFQRIARHFSTLYFLTLWLRIWHKQRSPESKSCAYWNLPPSPTLFPIWTVSWITNNRYRCWPWIKHRSTPNLEYWQ